MNALDCAELNFLVDAQGAIIAFQEKDQSWAGALAFSSEEAARRFLAASRLEVAEVAAIALDDRASIAGLIAALKKRPIRYLLLDLDYASGACRQVDFAGGGFGAVTPRQFTAHRQHS
ncbi:MAG TPA: hypothetical protein VKS22_06230 [Candidatus Binataceae bacterium]|nr:hypothetical protein [Candidatus Binataceae bacterium]